MNSSFCSSGCRLSKTNLPLVSGHLHQVSLPPEFISSSFLLQKSSAGIDMMQPSSCFTRSGNAFRSHLTAETFSIWLGRVPPPPSWLLVNQSRNVMWGGSAAPQKNKINKWMKGSWLVKCAAECWWVHRVSPVVAGEVSFVEGPPGGPPRGAFGDSGGSKAEGSYLKKKIFSLLGLQTWVSWLHCSHDICEKPRLCDVLVTFRVFARWRPPVC